MKYCVYDKAADGYLTKMVFEVGYSEHTQFECALTEYITNAELLGTKKAAVDAIARIESFKFMEKGRFVVHSFDDTLANQYVISEAGNPTKVVDNITVDLDGTIDVKYGTMACHWSTTSLIYVINKLNKLQDASAPTRYCSWNATFNIYKVITVIDENGHNHYQFINVTDEGVVSAKKEENSLNKRIEELEKENDKLKAAVESIKKETRHWTTMYKSEAETLDILKDVVDTIYTDLQSVTACDDLKGTLKALSHNSDLDHMFMPTKTGYVLDKGNCLTAKDEIYYIVNQIITILESRELNQSVAFSSAEEVDRAKKLANDIIDICEAPNDKFEVTLKKFSQLYEAVNDPSDDDDTIMYAFKGVLEIFSSLDDHVRGIIDESVTWKCKAMEAEKSLAGQKALNNANVDVIEHMRTAGADWKRRAEEAIRDYTKCNEALGEWKKKYRAIQEERDRALEQKEFYKRQANSVYGITIPTRFCSRQLMADILSGKKIPIDKKKYDDLVESLNNLTK